MTRSSHRTLGLALALLAVVALAACTAPAQAQCSTCVTPTVAYSPVTYAAAAPVATTVAYPVDAGWYPGRMFDRWRMRRWSATATAAPVYTTAYAPTYTAAYAPAYTAAYAPTYTAAYAPATYTAAYAPATYTAGYAPYVTGYAPLSRPVVQTSYYAPATVYSPAAISPVVDAQPAIMEAPAAACGTPACSACADAPTTVVEQAGYVQPAAAAAPCPCAGVATTIDYGTSAPAAGTPSVGPDTGVPELPVTPAPGQPNYSAKPSTEQENPSSSEIQKTPGPAAEDEIEPKADPNASFDAPQLLPPNRTANRPTVDVHNAVYRQPARTAAVSTTAARPVVKTQAEIDMEGWVSVPRN